MKNIAELETAISAIKADLNTLLAQKTHTSNLRNEAHKKLRSLKRKKAWSQRRLRFRRFSREQDLGTVLMSTIPVVAAGVMLILAHVATQSWIWAWIVSVSVAIYSVFILRSFLFYPKDHVLVDSIIDCDIAMPIEILIVEKCDCELALKNVEIAPLQRQLFILEAALRQQRLLQCWEYKASQLFCENWRAMRGIEFEQFLCRVFQHLGYKVNMTPTTGDQGVDLVAYSSVDSIAVQAKGYQDSVGNKAVQEVFAGRVHYNCRKCAVITNSWFTASARQLAESTNCMLIDSARMHDFVYGKIIAPIQNLGPMA